MISTASPKSHTARSAEALAKESAQKLHALVQESTFELGDEPEKEMPRSHKGLVDTCFEEGHCRET